MTSDRLARLIIKELVKAAIRKVIELIMEERLIYDEYTGQPMRVHIAGRSSDKDDIELVTIIGPKEHLGKGIYSSYRHEIPKTMWDKLHPADPTRTQLSDRVKEALRPLGLEVTSVGDHNPYNCIVITANEFDSRGENRDQFNPEAFLPRYKPTDTFAVGKVRDTEMRTAVDLREVYKCGDSVEVEVQSGWEQFNVVQAWPKQVHVRKDDLEFFAMADNIRLVPIDSRGLHLPDAQSIRDGAVGKVGDTEMQAGGLVNPVSSYVNAPLDKGNHDWKIKGRDFTKDFKKGGVIKTADHLYLITDVHPDYMDVKDVYSYAVTRVEGLTYDDKGIAVIGGHMVLPPLSTAHPSQVRQRLADFQGVPLHEVVAFKDVQIDGTDVRDFCFCCGDDDGHEIGCAPGCVGGEPECVAATSEHGIEIGDTVQSIDNGRSSGGDGVVTQINCSSHKVKWGLSGKETWWGVNELEVLTRGKDVDTHGMGSIEYILGEKVDKLVRGMVMWSCDPVSSSCSCANPECTWRNSLNCRYDTYSDLEERGAIE